MQKENPNCCVLVVSCDAYADLWPPFFTLFKRYWPDCPYPVYLSSNFIPYPNPEITTVLIGKDHDWSTSLMTALAMPDLMDYAYLLLILDDLLITKVVETSKINQCLDFLHSHQGSYIRLSPVPPPDIIVDGCPWVGQILPGAPYRASLQASIWKKDCLQSLLKPGESPWDFEILASRRSDVDKRFFCTVKRSFHYINSVVRGQWTAEALELLNKEYIVTSTSNRNTQPIRKQKAKIFTPWTMLPLSWRMKARAKFHRYWK